ncbi:CidA/LrgA family protein [Cohaesibacter intestini]|uniref:CidA/LrgA family protein n=1 Tax=Cohaesibacter intestini TaxID=2211145 RepID=UPI001FE1506C|nr:CidA/LrgA family protein [Cohaesibacter intestini]
MLGLRKTNGKSWRALYGADSFAHMMRAGGIDLLFALTLIFLCQLLGESIVTLLDLPVPGPVVGMALLFVGLSIKGGIPADIAMVGDNLLKHLSLLFIPAGVGVMLHAELLRTELLPISAALLVSTLLAIAATGLMMRWLMKDGKSDAQETSQ